jgi:alpha/beta superfamily hydrolase
MNAAASPAEPVRIAGPAGALEALVELPAAPQPARVAVICHPHPLHGGTLTNKVVYTLARALQARGAVAVRFNYRGVGASEGQYDGGVGEVEDALAAVAYAAERWPASSLILAGFSFGANVVLRAATRSAPEWLICVAPAVAMLRGPLEPPKCPWLIVQGDADEIVDASQVQRWAAGFTPPPQLHMLEGVGHFFHGRLHELGELVQRADPLAGRLPAQTTRP